MAGILHRDPATPGFDFNSLGILSPAVLTHFTQTKHERGPSSLSGLSVMWPGQATQRETEPLWQLHQDWLRELRPAQTLKLTLPICIYLCTYRDSLANPESHAKNYLSVSPLFLSLPHTHSLAVLEKNARNCSIRALPAWSSSLETLSCQIWGATWDVSKLSECLPSHWHDRHISQSPGKICKLGVDCAALQTVVLPRRLPLQCIWQASVPFQCFLHCS